jgi:hypothetical protein
VSVVGAVRRECSFAKVERMKAARVVVLVIALGAGGIAALLAGRSEKPAPQAVQVKPETVDVREHRLSLVSRSAKPSSSIRKALA